MPMLNVFGMLIKSMYVHLLGNVGILRNGHQVISIPSSHTFNASLLFLLICTLVDRQSMDVNISCRTCCMVKVRSLLFYYVLLLRDNLDVNISCRTCW